MSAVIERLGDAIEADRPCGADLEDGPVLGTFNAYRLFGRVTPWESTGDSHGGGDPAPEWAEVRGRALETLRSSKDLRVLVYLAAALVRTDGLGAFCATLAVAADWLERYWDSVYPSTDEDGVLRRNALSCFGDRIGIIDGVRRASIAGDPKHGMFSLRDVEFARGTVPPPADVEIAREAVIEAAFAATPWDELKSREDALSEALAAIKRIESGMTTGLGSEASPDLKPLADQLGRILKVLREQMSKHPSSDRADESKSGNREAPGAASLTTGTLAGTIRTRQDAERALDAVAHFFSETEPSSPVPIFVERAKRLIAKNFLQVLADMVPDAVEPARRLGGVQDST